MHWHCLCDLWLGWWRNAVCSFWLHRKPVGISCPRWWRHKKIEKIEFKLRETEQWVTELFTTIPKYFRGICVLIRTVSTQNSTPGCWNCWGFCLELLVQVAVCGWEKGCQCLFSFLFSQQWKTEGWADCFTFSACRDSLLYQHSPTFHSLGCTPSVTELCVDDSANSQIPIF